MKRFALLLISLTLLPVVALAAATSTASEPDLFNLPGAAAKTDNSQATKKSNDSSDSTADLFSLIEAHNKKNDGVTSGETPEEGAIKPTETEDPLEPYNRLVYKFNDRMDKYVAKPVSRIYNKIMPRPLNNMVNHFFNNVDNITTVANDLLQFNFYQATSDSWRLLVNSTVGIGGAFDVASDIGLEENVEDFGLTLAKWGWTDSDYFMIPVLGPSTVRDAGGKPINYEMSIFPRIKKVFYRNSLYVYYLLNERAQLLRYQGVFDSAAIDPYVFVRDAYLQRRAYLVKRNDELSDPYTAKDMQPHYDSDYLYQ
jgi:phospholipid-binding lipoprotein MlaA